MPGEVHRYATKPKSIADFSQMQTHPAFKVELGTMPTQHDLVKISEHIEKAKNSKDDGNEIAKEIEELSKNWGDSNNRILVEIAQFPTLKLTKDDALNFGFSLSDIVDLSFDKSKDVNIFLEANNVFSLSVNSNRICKEFMKSDYTKERKLKTHDRFVSEKYEREIYELGNIWYHREGLAKIGRKKGAPSNVVYLRIPYIVYYSNNFTVKVVMNKENDIKGDINLNKLKEIAEIQLGGNVNFQYKQTLNNTVYLSGKTTVPLAIGYRGGLFRVYTGSEDEYYIFEMIEKKSS